MPSSPPPETESAQGALREWADTVRDLCDLAGKQADAIVASDSGALGVLLAEKERLYRRAEGLSQRFLALKADAPGPDDPEARRLRAELEEALRELADREARSEAALAQQLSAIRAELDGLRRGRTMHSAYAAAPAAAPRFLDQRS